MHRRFRRPRLRMMMRLSKTNDNELNFCFLVRAAASFVKTPDFRIHIFSFLPETRSKKVKPTKRKTWHAPSFSSPLWSRLLSAPAPHCPAPLVLRRQCAPRWTHLCASRRPTRSITLQSLDRCVCEQLRAVVRRQNFPSRCRAPFSHPLIFAFCFLIPNRHRRAITRRSQQTCGPRPRIRPTPTLFRSVSARVRLARTTIRHSDCGAYIIAFRHVD